MIRELLSPDDNSARSQKRKKRRGSKSSQENAKILPDSQGNITGYHSFKLFFLEVQYGLSLINPVLLQEET